MPLPRSLPAGNAPVVLGILGIAGHMMDCMMSVVSVAACLALSLLALILGIVQARKHTEPRVVLNGRLGAILGFFGLIGGIVLFVISVKHIANML